MTNSSIFHLASRRYTWLLLFYSMLLIVMGINMSCTANKHQKENIVQVENTNKQSYTALLQMITEQKKKVDKTNTILAQQTFQEILFHQLIPYWVGTPWDFNGVTQTPQQGNIACGYFVTTLLRDAGVQINRVKMAQCVSMEMMKSLVGNEGIKNYSTKKWNVFINEMQQKNNTISVIGLDFHVGFIIVEKGKAYFVHSNYINREGVIIEEANTSIALQSSKTRFVGNLTQSKAFMQKWVSQNN